MSVKFGQLDIGASFFFLGKPFLKTSKNGATVVKPVAIGSIVLNPHVTALIRPGTEVEI